MFIRLRSILLVTSCGLVWWLYAYSRGQLTDLSVGVSHFP